LVVLRAKDESASQKENGSGEETSQNGRDEPGRNDLTDLPPVDGITTGRSAERESNDTSDDGVGGGHVDLVVAREEEPESDPEKRTEHAEHEEVLVVRVQLGSDCCARIGGASC